MLKAPFPAFGGKSKVAPLVWSRFGNIDNYIEPFFNSGAVLWQAPYVPHVATVNDLNCYIANFWRAVAECPDAVAEYANWPVNETDMHARHKWLLRSEESARFRQRMKDDPDYFNTKIAGWWVWGQCCWIGSGWCDAEQDSSQIPDLGNGTGRGVVSGKSLWQQVPDLGTRRGVIRNGGRVQLGDAYARGRGVNGNDNAETDDQRLEWLKSWFRELSARLRPVRVCCGHWDRICSSPTTTIRLGRTAIFLDPPYPTHDDTGKKSRSGNLYGKNDGRDALDVLRDEVLDYCKKRGGHKMMRIAVCGYDTDGYAELEEYGWRVESWKANGGYGNSGGAGNENARRERIWFSPHCVFKKQGLIH